MATSTAPRKSLTACDPQVLSGQWGVDPGLYVSHVIYSWLSFQLSRITLNCASFESYIRQNFGFFPLLTRIVCCLANNGTWTEWGAIWSEIICVISKSKERAAWVRRFEITSMISAKTARPEVQLSQFNSQICRTMAFLSFIFVQYDWSV